MTAGKFCDWQRQRRFTLLSASPKHSVAFCQPIKTEGPATPATFATLMTAIRHHLPSAPQAARRRTGDLSRRQCADHERRLSCRAPARARGALPAADLGGGRQGGRRSAQRARRPGPLRRRARRKPSTSSPSSWRPRRSPSTSRPRRSRITDRRFRSPSPRPERCASGSRRQARQDWLWIRIRSRVRLVSVVRRDRRRRCRLRPLQARLERARAAMDETSDRRQRHLRRAATSWKRRTSRPVESSTSFASPRSPTAWSGSRCRSPASPAMFSTSSCRKGWRSRIGAPSPYPAPSSSTPRSTAVVTFLIHQAQEHELSRQGRQLRRLMGACVVPVCEMERVGIPLDRDRHQTQIAEWNDKLPQLRDALSAVSGGRDLETVAGLQDHLDAVLPAEERETWPTTPTGKLSTAKLILKLNRLPPRDRRAARAARSKDALVDLRRGSHRAPEPDHRPAASVVPHRLDDRRPVLVRGSEHPATAGAQ